MEAGLQQHHWWQPRSLSVSRIVTPTASIVPTSIWLEEMQVKSEQKGFRREGRDLLEHRQEELLRSMVLAPHPQGAF